MQLTRALQHYKPDIGLPKLTRPICSCSQIWLIGSYWLSFRHKSHGVRELMIETELCLNLMGPLNHQALCILYAEHRA